MITFKIDIIQAMSDIGYTPSRIRKEKLIPEATMSYLRHNGNITLKTLNTICNILHCQPADLIQYKPD